jgi:hypothetical protein
VFINTNVHASSEICIVTFRSRLGNQGFCILKLKEIVTTLECVEYFENEEGAQVQTIGFLAMYFYSCIRFTRGSVS